MLTDNRPGAMQDDSDATPTELLNTASAVRDLLAPSNPAPGQLRAEVRLRAAVRAQQAGRTRRSGWSGRSMRMALGAAAAVIALAGFSFARPEWVTGPVQAAGGLFSGSSASTKVEVRLVAATSDPLASGKAKSESRDDRLRFGVEVEDVSTSGTHEIRVTRGGTPVANSAGLSVIVDALGFGDLDLDSRDGQTVPSVQPGDLIEVVSPGGVTILSGTLAQK